MSRSHQSPEADERTTPSPLATNVAILVAARLQALLDEARAVLVARELKHVSADVAQLQSHLAAALVVKLLQQAAAWVVATPTTACAKEKK